MIDLEAIRALIKTRHRACAIADPNNWNAATMPADPEGHWVHFRAAEQLLAYVDALRAAAGKVECMCCAGGGRREIYERGDLIGEFPPIGDEPCPDCADLRKLLGERHE